MRPNFFFKRPNILGSGSHRWLPNNDNLPITAQPTAGALAAADAADFDGTDTMSRAALSGISSSRKGIISFWFRMDGGDGNWHWFLRGYDSVDEDPALGLARDPSNTLFLSMSQDAAFVAGEATLSTFTTSATWHHCFISWDSGNDSGCMMIDGENVTYVDEFAAPPSQVAFNYAACNTWRIGGLDASTERLEGCLAEFYFAPGQYLDGRNPLKLERFRLPNGQPADLGSDGSAPTGVAPAIYLHLDDGEAVANFATDRSGNGNTFTITGTLATCSTSPTDGFGGAFSQGLSATLSFVGDMSKRAGKTTSAALSFIGALNKRAGKVANATLNFVGALNKRTSRALEATLSFVGALSASRLISAALTATLSFVGSLSKQTGKAANGTLSFAGTLNKHTSRALTAALSFVGTLSVSRLINAALASTLSFVGALTKRTGKAESATLSFVGTLNKRPAHVLTAALSFVGTLNKRAGKATAGTLNFVGALSKRAGKAASATLSFSGNLRRHTSHVLTATLNFVGDFMGNLVGGPILYQQSLNATLNFIGSLNKHTSRATAASLSFVGTLSKSFPRALTATLNFAGTLNKSTGKATSATLDFVGALSKRTSRAFTATLSFIGNMSATRLITVAFTATLSFSGDLISSFIGGVVSASTQIFRVAARSVTWVLTRRIGKAVPASARGTVWVLTRPE